MKWFFCFFCLLFWSLLIASDRIPLNPSINQPQIDIYPENRESFRVEIRFPDLILTDTLQNAIVWSQLLINGMGSSGEIGSPQLPQTVRLFAIEKSGDYAAEFLSADIVEYSGISVFPAQPKPIRDNGSNAFQIDYSVYQQNRWYPEAMVSDQNEAILREQRILPVGVYPVQFNPVVKKMRIARSLSFRVSLKSGRGENVMLTGPNIPSRSFIPLYKNFIDNFSFSDMVAYGETPGLPDMLIITHDQFYQTVIPFAEWKRQKGIPCEIVRLSDIGINPGSTPIKNFIQNYYDSAQDKPDFLLLVGDVNGSYPLPWFSVSGSMTDLPYYYLAGNDLLPDISGGRISVKTQAEATTVFSKLIRYENNPAIPPSGWFHSALIINSSDFQDPASGFWAKNQFLNYGYNPVIHLGDNLGNATVSNVLNAVDAGVGYIYYIGHGSSASWGTTGFSTSYIPQLTNGQMQPVISSVACNNADLDVSSDVFAEVWLKNNVDRGAVGVLGFTESVSAYEPDTMARGMVRALLSDSVPMFGNMIDFGRLHMFQSFGTGCTDAMYQSLLVGEPSLQVWTSTPRLLSVNVQAAVVPGAPIPVEVTDSLGVVSDALVCYSDSSGNYDRGYTDINGTVVLNPLVMEPGSGLITVTSPNAVPASIPVDIIPPAGPYLLVKNLLPFDTLTNNNQIVEAGEHFFFQLELENIGIEPADNIRIRISSADSMITFLKDTSLFGGLSPSGVSSGGNLEAVVDSSCRHEYRLALDVLLGADGGHQWQQIIWLPVRSGARIKLVKDTVDFPDTFLRHRNIREITLENNGPDTLRVDTIFCNLPQFDFPKTVITVPGGESETVQIGFTPDSTLFYNGFITIRNNDPVNFNRNLMVRGTGIYSPEIAVTDSLIFYASAVDSQKQVLQIRNDGLGDLNFSLQVVGHKPGEKLNEGTGGTDTFGHIWVDSDEPNGPAFNWISVSDSIVPIAMTGNNSISNAIRMEFPFSFYGVEYNQFRICTNGWISFTTFSVAYNNLFLPDVMAPRSLIAPLWDDLVMNQNSRVFVEQTANKVIVEFRDFYRISGEGPYTFEVILYENNNIILQYLSLDSLMHDYTVGIQDHLATDGLTISCDEPYLKDSLVVMISRHSWLSAEPLSGTVKPGESVDINVNIKTNQFPLGDFFAGIEIESNDPDRELVTVPVHMIVGLTALENRENIIPSRLELFQNYPNPFNPETTIKYSLPEENNVELVVYNLLGQKVKTLVLQRQRAGYHSIAWDGRNDNGAEAGAGVYVYRLKADSRTIIRKMVLVK